jgi:hypothetical protein
VIDVFCLFMLWTVLPTALPVGTPPAIERVCFTGWAAVQVALLAFGLGYLVWRAVRATWSARILVVALAAIGAIGAFAYNRIQWDAQAVYDRVAHLAVLHRGVWTGFVHGGNDWILSYPPGASLTVVWGVLCGLPSSNFAHAVLMWLWGATLVVRVLPQTGLKRSGLVFFVLLFVYASPIPWAIPWWHYWLYYNNIFFSLVWMQFILCALIDLRMRPWEHLAYALVLVWLRPFFGIAALPVLSAGAIALLRGRPWKPVLWLTAAALVVQLGGVRAWHGKVTALTEAQGAYQRSALSQIEARRDPHALAIDLDTSIHAASRTTAPSAAAPLGTRRRIFIDAVVWAWAQAWAVGRYALLFLIMVPLGALVLGWRRALGYLLPLFNVLALVVGTGFFALGFPAYRANVEAFERMLIIAPILVAAVAVAFDRDLGWALARARRASSDRQADGPM